MPTKISSGMFSGPELSPPRMLLSGTVKIPHSSGKYLPPCSLSGAPNPLCVMRGFPLGPCEPLCQSEACFHSAFHTQVQHSWSYVVTWEYALRGFSLSPPRARASAVRGALQHGVRSTQLSFSWDETRGCWFFISKSSFCFSQIGLRDNFTSSYHPIHWAWWSF